MGSRFRLCYGVTAKSEALIVLPLYEALNVCLSYQTLQTRAYDKEFISFYLPCLAVSGGKKYVIPQKLELQAGNKTGKTQVLCKSSVCS